jgi:hypothetical protein
MSLKGREIRTGGEHHHAHADEQAGDDHVDYEEGQVDAEAHQEGGLEFAEHVGRDEGGG